MPDLVIRPAVQDDLEILWDFLAIAAYEPHAEAAQAVPFVAKYLIGWQRPGDFGVIAEQHGEILGAAWARRFSTAELKSPYGAQTQHSCHQPPTLTSCHTCEQLTLSPG